MNLNIETTQEEAVHRLLVEGEVDAYTAPKLKEALIPLTEQEGDRIYVDLSAVSYMDSTGLGVFVGAYKSAKANGSVLQLEHLTDRVARLFEITGLSDVMNINETGGEANGGNI